MGKESALYKKKIVAVNSYSAQEGLPRAVICGVICRNKRLITIKSTIIAAKRGEPFLLDKNLAVN